jgi:hypothetical protein
MRSTQGRGRHLIMLAAMALTVVFALSYVVPAVGGPRAVSSASPLSLAKKSLKTAKKANRTAKQAKKQADQATTMLSSRTGLLGSDVRTVSSAPVTIAPGAVQIASVNCPAGTVVVSGGYALIGPEASVFSNRRSGNGWSVGGDNVVAMTDSATLTVDAQCAVTGGAVAARRSSVSDPRRDQRLAEQQRASHETK